MLHEPASDVDSVLTPDLNVSCPDAHWLRELRAERILEDEFERIEAARCEFVDNKERQGTTRIVPETGPRRASCIGCEVPGIVSR